MPRHSASLLILLLTICSPAMLRAQSAPAPAAPPTAAAAIARAIDAIGGAERLAGLRSVRIETIGHVWALEQSERPEGPWLARYIQRTELRDVAGRRLHRQTQTRDWSFPRWSPDPPATLIVSGGTAAHRSGQQWRPGTDGDLQAAAEALALSPERLLLTARDAPDLARGPSEVLHDVTNHSVTFTWHAWPVTLFLNSWTHRPTMLRIVRDDPFGIWGDVTEQRWYGWWDLQKGLWYPRQVTVDWNGYPFSDTSATVLEIDAALDDTAFEIPPDTAAAFARTKDRPFGLATLTLDDSKAIDLAAGVVLLPGVWNVLLVRQPDGVVIVEGPVSSAYSQQVIAAAAKRFPGVPVKAVVTTSDAWPHIGGIREYVARGLDVYALDLNVAILDRLVRSTRTRAPDSLSRRPTTPRWHAVSSAATIGTGERRIHVIPVRGELGERMMIAWLPGLRLAYSSDLIQPNRGGGFFMPGMLTEVAAALARANAGVPARVVGMHLMPIPWSDVETAIRESGGR